MKTTKTESAARGQSIRTDYGRDNSSHDLKNTMGGKMGGSTTNLAHSMSGASAQQEGNPGGKKNRFS